MVRPKVRATAFLIGCSEIEYKNEMSDMVNVNNVLECCRLGKDIIFTEGQRIAADPVVVIAEQEIFCLGLVADGEAAGTEDLQLFFDCLKILVCHIITPYKQNALKCACVSTEA